MQRLSNFIVYTFTGRKYYNRNKYITEIEVDNYEGGNYYTIRNQGSSITKKDIFYPVAQFRNVAKMPDKNKEILRLNMAAPDFKCYICSNGSLTRCKNATGIVVAWHDII